MILNDHVTLRNHVPKGSVALWAEVPQRKLRTCHVWCPLV